MADSGKTSEIKKRRYKALNGGVRSFTEGFTGLLNCGFSRLGHYAIEHRLTEFHFNILTSESRPELYYESWYPLLIYYIEPIRWCDEIGCSIDFINTFIIDITFDFSEIHKIANESGIPFDSITKIIDDKQKEYIYKHHGCSWA